MKNGWLKRAGFAAAAGFLALLAAAGGLAWLILRGSIGEEHLGLASAAALIAGGLTAGLSAGGGEGRLVRCGAAAGGLVLVLLALNLLLFDGSLFGLLPGVLIIAGSVGAGGLLGGGGSRGGRRKYRRRSRRNR